MHWLVYGAGAVGGVLGARMYDAGLDVTLVARGDHLAAIRSRGLTVAAPDGERTIDVPVVGSAAEADLTRPTTVLLAVKSHQTHAAVEDLVAALPGGAPVVSLQNGVANELALLRFFADVQGVCVMMPSGHLEPGVVEQHCAPVPGILDVGGYPGGVGKSTLRVVEAFATAGFVSEPRADIMAWKRRKLMMNLGNAVQACCGDDDPDWERLLEVVEAEGEAALAASGLTVVSRAEDRERRGDILRRGELAGRPRGGGSSWQSLRRAQGNIESDYLNGEVVLLGRLHSVPTPANELLRVTAGRLAREGAAPASVRAADLLSRLA
jgi:2-dehydropantoate 2-reductase